ncbi:CLUMA_CG020273, isoform A [Clunio marinus]|uniref:CLUMA_CG020273, isoform A n=1 Tax=Clunio marinus TaxID=568069 RepID=A0A1J1J748_9DIPT|nr:CLUMA_CG020273, isoform A [Clunio marinus]
MGQKKLAFPAKKSNALFRALKRNIPTIKYNDKFLPHPYRQFPMFMKDCERGLKCQEWSNFENPSVCLKPSFKLKMKKEKQFMLPSRNKKHL